MKRERSMSQMKEEGKTSEKKLNRTKIINIPEKEFKVMVIRMPTRFEKRVDEMSEFNKRKKISKRTNQS